MTIGECIKVLCAESGIPVSRLERECNFSNGYIRSVAKNSRDIPDDKFERICRFLESNNVDTSRLLTDVNGKNANAVEPEELSKQKRIFVANLKSLMELKNVNSKELSIYTGIPATTISNWLNCNSYPRVEKLDVIADFFGCTRDELVKQASYDETKTYYMDSEAVKIAELMKENPKYAILFDASRKVKPDDLEKVIKMIQLMSGDD